MCVKKKQIQNFLKVKVVSFLYYLVHFLFPPVLLWVAAQVLLLDGKSEEEERDAGEPGKEREQQEKVVVKEGNGTILSPTSMFHYIKTHFLLRRLLTLRAWGVLFGSAPCLIPSWLRALGFRTVLITTWSVMLRSNSHRTMQKQVEIKKKQLDWGLRTGSRPDLPSSTVHLHCHWCLCCPRILSLCGWKTWAGMSTADKIFQNNKSNAPNTSNPIHRWLEK